MQELLYCFVGNGGQHIVPQKGNHEINFQIDKYVDKSLQALVSRLLPLASNYSKVVAWCEQVDKTDGLVNQALAAALDLLLDDFRMLICPLEQSLYKGQSTLHQLHHQLYKSIVNILISDLVP